jgi:hypothetical protein
VNDLREHFIKNREKYTEGFISQFGEVIYNLWETFDKKSYAPEKFMVSLFSFTNFFSS